MKSFMFNSQTAMFFGHNCIRENADFFEGYGKSCVVFTSKFPANCRNLGLEDIESVLDAGGIERLVIDSVCTDPPVEAVAGLAASLRGFNADFFIAVGGGSSIDTAKAVAFLLQHPVNADPYELFWGRGSQSRAIRSEVDIPIFAVPTTAGTGAEVTPYAVLTRGDLNTKGTMYSNAFPTAAFLDSRYIKGSPDFLLHAGVFDALAHGVESYLHTESTPIGRMLTEFGFKLFASFKDNMARGELTDDDLDSMQLAAFIQGMAFMQSSTTIPHGLGYPLSHIKHVAHGLASAVFIGEYLKGFRDQTLPLAIVKMCGFDDCDEFASFCDGLLADDLQLGVTEQEIEVWTDNFMRTQTLRLETNPESLTREDIKGLYMRSLGRYIVGSAQRAANE